MSELESKFLKTLGLIVVVFAMVLGTFAQFPIKVPKISIPKINKPNSPSGTSTPNSSSSQPASTSADSQPSPSNSGENFIAGAKLYFSNAPFTCSSTGAASSFTSADYLNYGIDVEANGQRTYYALPRTEPILITKEQAKQTYLNFDVLPDPNKITTIAGRIADDRSYYFDPAPLYALVGGTDVRQIFPKTGTYKVTIRIDLNNFDEWGEMQREREKFPAVVSAFTFQFNVGDAQTLAANNKKASENALTARNRMETLTALPEWWGKTRAPSDPKLTVARLTPLLRDYTREATYLNKFVWGEYSLPLWTIHKDSYGLPSYRFGPQLWALYKHNKDGTCFFVRYSPRETYSGAGTYGPLHLQAMTSYTYVDCSAVR